MSEIDLLPDGDQHELTRRKQEEELKQLILRLTEEKTEQRNKLTRREEEKIELIGNRVTSIQEYMDMVSEAKNPYQSFFFKELYEHICRLSGLPVEWAATFEERGKHKEFADFTNEVIHGRYMDGVVQFLQLKNPYIGITFRKYKLSQFLSPEGVKRLELFIEQAYDAMRTCNTMIEFRRKMLSDYGLPYQGDLFEGNK